MYSGIPIGKTFLKNRKCLHCKKPIADQEHASLKFCAHQDLPDSAIKSCKDAYHTPRKKIKYDPYLKLVTHHKLTANSIMNLLSKNGNIVTGAELDQYGILLSKPVEFMIPPSQKGCYTFIGYDITHIEENKYKITEHERTI